MSRYLNDHAAVGLALLGLTGGLRAQVPTPVAPANPATASATTQPQTTAPTTVTAGTTAPVDAAGRLYVSRCTGCHTIGRGMLTGPDLTAAIAWPEADLKTAIVRMQEKAGALGKDEVADLIRFLKDPAVKDRIAAEEARIVAQFAATLEPPDAATGERLFRGEQLFANGGMACLACHRIGDLDGGTLGPDLTGVFGRMGETGLLSALEKSPFKVMAPVYREKPLTRQEAIHLTRWIQDMEAVPAVPETDPVLPAAASIAALGLAALVLGIRGPKRTSARESLAIRRRS